MATHRGGGCRAGEHDRETHRRHRAQLGGAPGQPGQAAQPVGAGQPGGVIIVVAGHWGMIPARCVLRRGEESVKMPLPMLAKMAPAAVTAPTLLTGKAS